MNGAPRVRGRLANRGYVPTLVLLLVAAELLLRLVPLGPPALFRTLYGSSLSMYMAVDQMLEERGAGVRVLALGDSLAMTQFQPERFAEKTGVPPASVASAAYLGMSFPSQEALLEARREELGGVETVLFFLNPRRLSSDEVTNTEVFRVAIPPAEGSLRAAWRTGRINPLLDRSHLYGLSRHLVLQAAGFAARKRPGWDQIEYLAPQGGVLWPDPREEVAAPTYPFPPLAEMSEERLAELRSVLANLTSRGIRVVVLPSANHSEVDPFATPAAERAYHERVRAIAESVGASYHPDALEGFVVRDDRSFCDYGHTDLEGGRDYTDFLAERPALWRAGSD